MKRDVWIGLALVMLAAAFRFWHLPALGLTHFDEGSYALAGRWLATGGLEGRPPEPAQAPLLVPALGAVFFRLFGIHDYVAVAVSGVAGSLLVGVVYLVGARWFGRAVGLGGALLLTTAEYDLMYSRLFLTDETFTLLFWGSLVVLYAGVNTGQRRLAWLGGALTALCWNAKYHGFFPLLIVALWLAAGRRTHGDRAAAARWMSGAALVALAGFLPWVVAVALTTGWREIVIGLWAHSGAGGFMRTSPWTLWFYLHEWLAWPVLILAGLGALRSAADRRGPGRFLLLTLSVFLLSALFYRSFPRLILPVVPGLCLLAALGAAEIISAVRTPLLRVGVGFVVWVIVIGSALPGAFDVLRLSTDSYRVAARFLETRSEPVISQMSKNFYFYQEAASVEMRRVGLAELDRIERSAPAVVIAVDPVLFKLPEELAWFRSRSNRLELLTSIDLRVFEPLYYQGFNPGPGFHLLSMSEAPLRPGEARIDIYRLRTAVERD